MRTKLNFMAVGAVLPESLAGRPTDAQILRLRAANHAQLVLLEEIVLIAEQRQITESWLRMLKWAIAKNRFLNTFSIFGRIRRVLGSFKRRLVAR